MFENESTLLKTIIHKGEEYFDVKYEDAVLRVKEELGRTYPMIIDGKHVTTEGVFTVLSPIDTRVVVAHFPIGKEEHAKSAITAARNAFWQWSKIDYRERIKIFRQTADIISQRKYELSALLSFENGKNRYEAIGDIDEAIDFMRYYAEQMELNNGFVKQMKCAYPEEKSKGVMKPYGVWAVIAPFNFPIAITDGMCTGAMITGNTVVLKPASDTPLTSYKFYEILEEAGLPAGVINLITGSGSVIGKTLIESDDVDGISFTGSKEVGLSIYRINSKRPKPLITEMGSKNPALVTKNADLDKAVDGVFKAAFGYSGQKCSACSRVYVHKSLKEEFVNRLVKRTSELTVGNPLNKNSLMGPLINENAYEKYKKYTNIAKKEGKILTGGNVITYGDLEYGYYVQPTIVDKLPNDHILFKEEMFVPILCVTDYKEFDEALKLCNDVDYGLTAGIFSNDQNEINEFLDKIEAGVVYVNRARSATTGAMVGCQPFVGWKNSGISGKGTGSEYYLTLFMKEQSQTICD
ncbi:MAG: aldehyde dehydrogenase family protein [Thaumarchaeota archaeon]|nr:aldehyde dehydrogenase family protein [Nitrososphaerota archaeon]